MKSSLTPKDKYAVITMFIDDDDKLVLHTTLSKAFTKEDLINALSHSLVHLRIQQEKQEKDDN